MGKCQCYPHVEEFLFEICLREDIFNAITQDADRFVKFDTILSSIRDTYAVKIQSACNEIFGEDAIFVM